MSTTTTSPAKRNGVHDRVTITTSLMDCPACGMPIMAGYSGKIGVSLVDGRPVADIEVITGCVIRHDCRKGAR